MIPLIVFVSQLILVFFKHLAIRAIAAHKVAQTAVYTALIQLSWLIASALGINALLSGEWVSVIAYISGGVIGSLLQFKVKT